MPTAAAGGAGVRVTVPSQRGLTCGMISFWPYAWNKTLYPQLRYWHRLDGADVTDLPDVTNLFIRGVPSDALVSTIGGADTHDHSVETVWVAEDCAGVEVVKTINPGDNVPRHIRWWVMQYRPDLGP